MTVGVLWNNPDCHPSPGVWTGFRIPGNLVPGEPGAHKPRKNRGPNVSASRKYSLFWPNKLPISLGNQSLITLSRPPFGGLNTQLQWKHAVSAGYRPLTRRPKAAMN